MGISQTSVAMNQNWMAVQIDHRSFLNAKLSNGGSNRQKLIRLIEVALLPQGIIWKIMIMNPSCVVF
jgi:hypothetical protein